MTRHATFGVSLGLGAVLAMGLLLGSASPAAADPPAHAKAWGRRTKTVHRTVVVRRAPARYHRRPVVSRYPRRMDWDRDGIRNRRDWDKDGDGIRNKWDRRPRNPSPLGRRRDLDRDGIRNSRDRDRDGDGLRNRRDNHPKNPLRR